MALPEGANRDDKGYRLWQRLRDHDPVAPSDLALTYLDRLSTWLERRFPRASEHDRVTAAHDAIVGICLRPEIYKPERQGLEVFLRLAARGDLLNLWRAEDRHTQHQASLETVELSHLAGKYLVDEGTDPAEIVEAAEDALDPELAALLESLTNGERQTLRLMADGERRTTAYAVALGITHLSPLDQASEVKRMKDRLKKRVERWREKRDR